VFIGLDADDHENSMTSDDVRLSFVLANPFKEGDLAVGGTRDDRVREHARQMLLGTRVADIRRTVLVDDGVSATLARAAGVDADLDRLRIADLKEILLGDRAPAWARAYRHALPSEVIAAVVKVMSDDDLESVARRLFNPLPGHGVTVGAAGHLGSRIQPNSPGDDEEEILFSTLEGLAWGCGDVIIGVNPASDDVDTIVRIEQLLERVVAALRLPTRYCVLSDIVKQHEARARTRVDVAFQSLAGTSRALIGMVGLDVDGVLDLARDFDALYFETGQGSAVTNGAAEGVDMVTLESRAYGVARYLQRETNSWMIVNDVAGFIGPEVFRTAEQLERACLEDIVMAKLHGLAMGLDVCSTFHMGIPPATLRAVTERLVERAAPAYLMAVPGNADPMLGYLTTSFREHPVLRARTRRQMTSVMQARLQALGAMDRDGAVIDAGVAPSLYAMYARECGDRRASSTLADEGRRRFLELRERGFDLQGGQESSQDCALVTDRRLDAMYAHARRALYALVDEGVIRDVCPTYVRVRTEAVDREDYLAHPPAGERLRREDAGRVAALYRVHPPQVQMVVSDGLNANAVNEHLRALLPPLRRTLSDSGCRVGETDIVVQNGRVRVGYEIGGLADAVVIVHLLGERPGTGLNTLSAYLTYGRDETGGPRWRSGLDHSYTTAVCGVHPNGKPPEVAVAEIARAVTRMIAERRSGVAGLGRGMP
jgi:ethanolamine ammonia-lyase large subunit